MTGPQLMETLLARERAALDRWAQGNTLGYAESIADEATYFDHATRQRLHGAAAIRAHVGAFQGTFSVPRYEILDPVMHTSGDLAVLAFNWAPYDGEGRPLPLWNATSVYRRDGDEWAMVHMHWSQVTV